MHLAFNLELFYDAALHEGSGKVIYMKMYY